LAAEVAHLKEWLGTMPAINASTISVAAGLLRGALGNILRGNRSPQAERLDAIYKVLLPYGYKKISSDNKNN
jgi:transcriptional regulator with XRE-family HTH domain